MGWAFGLNEAMDQRGPTVGRLIESLVLYLRGGYREGFAVLLVSALLCQGTLTVARPCYPRPQELESKEAVPMETAGFSRTYWLSVAAGKRAQAEFLHPHCR